MPRDKDKSKDNDESKEKDKSKSKDKSKDNDKSEDEEESKRPKKQTVNQPKDKIFTKKSDKKSEDRKWLL